jgi:uncharacterized protein involved in response to NO
LIWIGLPDSRVAATTLALGAAFQTARLVRWAGDRTYREPLLAALHVGFAFVPVGYALLAVAAVSSVPATAGIHAWTAGAFGVMTLAVMTRASLGHTDHELTASPATRLIFVAVLLAAAFRIWAALQPGWSELALQLTAAAWATAFLGMAIVYGPMMCHQRKSAGEG